MQPEALDQCPWFCSAPQGPNTPFAWPAYFVIDSLRLAIIAGAILLIVISLWAIHSSTTMGQKCRFVGAIGLYFFVAGTELERIGDHPHWRFVVGLVAIPILLWGYYQHLRHELPAREKLEGQDES